MDDQGLARLCRSLRAEAGLTQEELAARIISDRTGEPVSKAMISRAESDRFGSEALGIRQQIVKLLTGKDLDGPYYRLPE